MLLKTYMAGISNLKQLQPQEIQIEKQMQTYKIATATFRPKAGPKTLLVPVETANLAKHLEVEQLGAQMQQACQAASSAKVPLITLRPLTFT